ncbi:MAG: biopolymer transporter ExbD [Phycisphaerae bacterium]
MARRENLIGSWALAALIAAMAIPPAIAAGGIWRCASWRSGALMVAIAAGAAVVLCAAAFVLGVIAMPRFSATVAAVGACLYGLGATGGCMALAANLSPPPQWALYWARPIAFELALDKLKDEYAPAQIEPLPAPPVRPEVLVVIRGRAGESIYEVEGRAMNLDGLTERLAGQRRLQPQVWVLIRGDRQATVQQVAQAVRACRKAGLRDDQIGYDNRPTD